MGELAPYTSSAPNLKTKTKETDRFNLETPGNVSENYIWHGCTCVCITRFLTGGETYTQEQLRNEAKQEHVYSIDLHVFLLPPLYSRSIY